MNVRHLGRCHPWFRNARNENFERWGDENGVEKGCRMPNAELRKELIFCSIIRISIKTIYKNGSGMQCFTTYQSLIL